MVSKRIFGVKEAIKYGIRLENVTHGFNGGGTMRMLYENASLKVPAGGLFVILGRNGVGKSTLLKSIAGLQAPLSGNIYIEDIPLKKLSGQTLAEKLSFVSTESIRIVNLSARSVVAMGRSPYTGWTGRLSPGDEAMVGEAMELVGAAGLADKNMDSLSDGERQRVMIARALAQDTPVIMLDEPTAFLDLPNRYAIALLLQRLAREHGKTVLFTTHDLDIALRLADSVCVIEGGRFHTGSPEDIMLEGVVDAMFGETDVSYDIYRSEIKLPFNKKGALFLDCPPLYRGFFSRALEKAGIEAAFSSDCPDSLKVEIEGKSLSMTLTDGDGIRHFNKVGGLLAALRGL